MANPSTIMGAAALDYWDIDAVDSLWQNSDGTTAVVDADPVGRWAGQLGNRNLTQPDGGTARPVYEDTTQAHIVLDGTDDYIEDTSGYAGAAFYFIARVFIPASVPNDRVPFNASRDFEGNTPPGSINTFTNSEGWGFIVSGFGGFGFNTLPLPRDQWITVELGFSASDIVAQIGANEYSATGASATAPDFSRFTFGANRQALSTGAPCGMRIARASFVSAIPDSTERTALRDWAENGDVGGAGEITGTLTAQETGSDAASASVEVVVSGTVAAQESGTDGAAASVAVGIAAALAGQETGSDLATATGAVSLEAALVAQEVGADSAAASASVAVGITISAQETGLDLASGSVTVAVAGAVAAQEAGSDGAAVSGAVAVAGALAAQEAGQDGASGSATVAVAGALAAQEAGSDGAAVSGAVAVTGALAAQESGADRAVIQAGSGRVVTLAAQEAGFDLAGASAAVAVEAALGAQEAGGDTAAVVVSVEDNVITVNLAAREAGADQAAVAVGVAVVAEFAGSETGADVASIRAFLFSGRQAFAGQSGSFTRGASGRRASQGAEGVRITRAG